MPRIKKTKSILEAKLDDEDDDDEDMNESESEEANASEVIEEAERESKLDIFSDVGERMAKNGICVKYIIHRDGSLLTFKQHPYSWEELLEDYGGGMYRVAAKHPVNSKYIRSQSQTLMGPKRFPAEKPQPMQQSINSQGDVMAGQSNMMEMFTMMQGMLTGIISPIIQNMNHKEPDTNKGMANILEQVTRSQQMQFEMITSMIRNQQEESKRSMEFQMKLLDKFNDKIERSLNDKETFSSHDVFKLIEDAKNNGIETMASLQKMAENMAYERAKTMVPSESGFEKVIALLAPFIGQFLGKPLLSPGETVEEEAREVTRALPKMSLPEPKKRFSEPQKPQNSTHAAHAPQTPTPAFSAGGLNTVRFAPPEAEIQEKEMVYGVTMRERQGAEVAHENPPAESLLVTKWVPKLMPTFAEHQGEVAKCQSIDEAVSMLDGHLASAGFDHVSYSREVSQKDLDAMLVGIPTDYAQLFRGLHAAALARAGKHSEARTDNPSPESTAAL